MPRKPLRTEIRFLMLLSLVIAVGLSALVCTKTPPLAPTPTNQNRAMILISFQSVPNTVAPGGIAVIQGAWVNPDGDAIANLPVQFSTNVGVIVPAATTTNAQGIATAQFTAPQQTGAAAITVSFDSTQTRTLTVEIKTSSQSITLTPEQNAILGNGVSSTRIFSRWLKDGKPVAAAPVTFETTSGALSADALTDSSGEAAATLTSVATAVDVMAQITARAAGEEAVTQVLFKGVSFEMSASPISVIADGRSTSTITVILKESTSKVAIAGETVIFGTDFGTIPNAGVSNSSGVARAELTSSTQTGVANVIAIYGHTFRDTVQVAFSQSQPAFLNVSADPSVIFADNQSTSKIKAVVSDQNNNAVPDGTPVNFEIIDGSGSIESNKVTTAGVAISTLTSSTKPDTVTIVVRVGQLTDTTTVRYIVGEVKTVSLTADSSSLPADGITSATVTAYVYDAVGHPVLDGTRVAFTTDIGNITPSAQTVNGRASAQFSSNVTGVATIRATVGSIFDEINIQLRPGPPNSILLSYNPNTLGVKDSGRNQSLMVTALVVDSKNNPVSDGTYVAFSLFSSPGGGEVLSSAAPVPTLNGVAQVSLNSGIRSGSVRILARVTDAQGVPIVPEVRSVSTEIIIFAGPPFIENINDRTTSHLSVGARPLNVYGWNVVNNIATVVALVGDKYNNPVPAGTAVYFTTTGGVISTHTGFTDDEGVATVTIHTGQPYPTIARYYNTFFDPNFPGNVIPGPIPDFENGEVLNSVGDMIENDGIVRILAETEGVDSNGNPARVWSVTNLVFSGSIAVFEVTASATDLSPGQSANIDFKIYDENGNPIVAGSEISVQVSAGALSWTTLTTSDPGITHYRVVLTNDLDPGDPNARETATPVTIVVNSPNGNAIQSSATINLRLN
jgi:adhesin/invasin